MCLRTLVSYITIKLRGFLGAWNFVRVCSVRIFAILPVYEVIQYILGYNHLEVIDKWRERKHLLPHSNVIK